MKKKMVKNLMLVLTMVMLCFAVSVTASAGLADDIKCAAGNHSTPREEVVTAATCGTVGVARVYCSNCNELLETKVIPATGVHTPVNVPAVVATCLTKDLTVGTKCSVCEEILAGCEEVKALGHDIKVMPATTSCENSGLTEGRVCIREGCNYVVTAQKEVGPLGHDWVVNVETSPTCVSEGVALLKCLRCSETTIETLSATGHKFGEWKLILSETCTKDGEMVAECLNCNEKSYRKIIAPGHDFSVETILPTCTEKGKKVFSCINCDEVIVEETEPIGHNLSVVEVEVIPTCVSEGKKVVRCFNCWEIKEEYVIEKTPHPYQSEWQTIIAPTCTETGVAIKICRNCFDIQTSTLSVIPHSDADADYKCDMCSLDMTPPQPEEPEKPSENCGCSCHKSGIAKFFFNIGLFFQKIFKKNAVCDCGVAHY